MSEKQETEIEVKTESLFFARKAVIREAGIFHIGSKKSRKENKSEQEWLKFQKETEKNPAAIHNGNNGQQSDRAIRWQFGAPENVDYHGDGDWMYCDSVA